MAHMMTNSKVTTAIVRINHIFIGVFSAAVFLVSPELRQSVALSHPS
jgi:hypothetical protein